MSLRNKLNPLSRKALVLALIALMTSSTPMHYASAQDLDDEIDAELDDVSAGDAPSARAKSGPSATLDDVELDADDGGAPPVAPSGAPSMTVDSDLNSPEDQNAGADPVIDDALDLDDGEGDTKTAKPSAPPAAPLVPQAEPESFAADTPAPLPSRRDVRIDAPNEAYEKRLGQISSSYKQVPDVSWEEIVGDRRQENYGIQKGDTLWDISGTFFGDGFFWAKLWSQNGVIGNPHMIVRGKAIRFVAGTESDAPAIGVMDTLVASNSEFVSINPLHETVNEKPTYREQAAHDITPEEVESGVVLENDELIPTPELPPPSRRTGVLKELPNSFRPPTALKFNEGYDSTGIKGAPSILADKPARSVLNSMIFDSTPASIGKIDEVEAQEQVAHQGQNVYIRLNREVPIGSQITFGRMRRVPAGAAGPVMDILGIGVVTNSIDEGRNAYRASVISSLAPVEKGSLVFDFAPPVVTFSKEGRRNEAQVAVVGGEFDDRRRLVGAGSVIYLAGGSNVDLRPGDILGVQAVRGERRATAYPKVKTPIAVIRIADVKNKVATAIVLVSTQPILIGDRTGGDVPSALPSLQSSTADQLVRGFSSNSQEAPNASSQLSPQLAPSAPSVQESDEFDLPLDQ